MIVGTCTFPFILLPLRDNSITLLNLPRPKTLSLKPLSYIQYLFQQRSAQTSFPEVQCSSKCSFWLPLTARSCIQSAAQPIPKTFCRQLALKCTLAVPVYTDREGGEGPCKHTRHHEHVEGHTAPTSRNGNVICKTSRSQFCCSGLVFPVEAERAETRRISSHRYCLLQNRASVVPGLIPSTRVKGNPKPFHW